MKEIRRVSTYVFKSREERDDFEARCRPIHKDYTGLEIMRSGEEVEIDDHEFKFKQEFDMISVVDFVKEEREKKKKAIEANSENSYIAYTDGACKNNPGKGGWGYVLVQGDHETEIERNSGHEPHTTNSKMEMFAVVQLLERIPVGASVDIYTDSAMIVNCFKDNWMVKWKKNGWVNSKRKPVENRELWEIIDKQVQTRTVTFNKVKGHAGIKFNEIADDLADRAAISH